jgi:hypothetical protein
MGVSGFRTSPARYVVLLTVAASLVSGCAVTNRLFRDRGAEERAAALLQTQLAVMRFADEYTARVGDQAFGFQQGTTDPAVRLSAQTWLVSQATAAFTIAAGPNPELNAIDMLVFATVSRMVIENRWIAEHGQRAAGLLAAHQALENRAWSFSTETLLTEDQVGELRSSIEAWHRQNPTARAVPFIHLQDFALAINATRPGSASSGSIFSFLGIDPLSGLDPAVRELAQTRQVAERAVYYGQRVPMLVSMEAKRLALEMAVTPESVQVLGAVDRIGVAAQSASDLMVGLPGLLATERAAAIAQVIDVLDARQGQLQALLLELRSALEAGGTTSDSVRSTVASMDALMARFDRSASTASGPPARPFDITEYTAALHQLGAAAEQLQALLGQADAQAPGLARLPDQAAGRLAELVDHVYWRLVQLVLVLVAASLVGALGYRAVAARWRRAPVGLRTVGAGTMS